MLNRIEVIDETGRTTFNVAYDASNPFAPFADHDRAVAEDTIVTIGRILGYAAHIFNGLNWVAVDGGERATIRYGRFTAWLYRNPVAE